MHIVMYLTKKIIFSVKSFTFFLYVFEDIFSPWIYISEVCFKCQPLPGWQRYPCGLVWFPTSLGLGYFPSISSHTIFIQHVPEKNRLSWPKLQAGFSESFWVVFTLGFSLCLENEVGATTLLNRISKNPPVLAADLCPYFILPRKCFRHHMISSFSLRLKWHKC